MRETSSEAYEESSGALEAKKNCCKQNDKFRVAEWFWGDVMMIYEIQSREKRSTTLSLDQLGPKTFQQMS
jgi:hypothetical protein